MLFSLKIDFCFQLIIFSFHRFVKKTLHNTQQLLVKEDPSKTTQPDFIHTLVTEHTAQLRERFLRDRATNDDGDYDMKQDSDGDSKSDVKGKGKDTKPKDEEEDFATDYNFAGMTIIINL